MNAKDKDLNAQKEVEKSLRAEQTKIKMSLKQKNVLNLEMDAYEKSLNETTQKLETINLQAVEVKIVNAKVKYEIKWFLCLSAKIDHKFPRDYHRNVENSN